MSQVYLLIFLVGLSASAGCTPRTEIERAYLRQQRAWELKFVDGILSCRSPDFVLTDPERVQVAESVQIGRLESLLATSLKIRNQATITRFQQLSPVCAETWMDFKTSIDRVEPDGKRKTWVLTTRSRDRWQLRRGSWWMTRSSVTDQSLTRP